jgi:2-amino-4-hydroxy-6-hydroxymethyldihydropteridine diphosphokinase
LACCALAQRGALVLSSRFVTTPRCGYGVNYCNMALQLDAPLSVVEMLAEIKHLEAAAGRVKPSDTVPLDIDLIAWQDGECIRFDPHRLPLAFDVILPMQEIWAGVAACANLHAASK